MTAADPLLRAVLADADHQARALSWLLEQWLSDVDREHADWCLEGLRHEDPELFDVLDAVHFADIGEELLATSPNENDPGCASRAVSRNAATPKPGPAA
jgi:hypothetical protein